jgi:hypothetical protein
MRAVFNWQQMSRLDFFGAQTNKIHCICRAANLSPVLTWRNHINLRSIFLNLKKRNNDQ